MKKITSRASIALLLALILTLAACNGAEEPAPAAGEPAAGSAVPQTANFQSVLAEGEVVPLEFVSLSFQTGGVAAEVLVEEGERVAAGDPLIRLDDTDLRLALDQAQARVTSAESGLAAAQARLAVARAGVDSAEQQVVAAQARLALVQAGPRPEEIEAVQKNLEAAEAGINRAAAQRDGALVVTDSAVEAARAEVASAQAQLISLEDSYQNIIDACFDTPQGEVCPLYGPIEEQTRAQLEAVRANAAAAQARLDQALAGATPGQRTAAQGGVTLATAQREVAQAQLDLLLAGATEEQVTQAEVGVRQAQAQVTIAQSGVTQAEAAVTQAEAAVQNAQAALNSAQVSLDRSTLTAPFDGTVGRITINEGQFVAPAQPVLILADLSGWLVKTTDLTELDVARIEPGSEVEVSFDAIPNETVSGTVTEVALISNLSQGDVVYEVTVRLNGTEGLPVRWGMTTFIDVNVN